MFILSKSKNYAFLFKINYNSPEVSYHIIYRLLDYLLVFYHLLVIDYNVILQCLL